MLTLKQIQAVYWVHVLGSYHAAAEQLNATQSTVTKRVQELEETLQVKLFEPLHRTQLTLKGREILGDLEKMLELQRSITMRVADDATYTGLFRLGVTEMVALTWLPALVSAVKQVFPRLVLEPTVNLSSMLWSQMRNQRLDMIMCPGSHTPDVNLLAVTLGTMTSSWMCSPSLFTPVQGNGKRNLEAMQEHPLLTYSEGSRLHLGLVKALRDSGTRFEKLTYCNSLIALAELATAGLGVTCLPHAYFSNYVEQGDLQVVDCSVQPPALEYQAIYRNDMVSQRIVQIASQVCDFQRPRRGGGLVKTR